MKAWKSYSSVDSRNFEMWGQFPPMSEKCGGLVNKNGNLYLHQRGINFRSICLSVCLLAGLHCLEKNIYTYQRPGAIFYNNTIVAISFK